jgi:hypothetical protein
MNETEKKNFSVFLYVLMKKKIEKYFVISFIYYTFAKRNIKDCITYK